MSNIDLNYDRLFSVRQHLDAIYKILSPNISLNERTHVNPTYATVPMVNTYNTLSSNKSEVLTNNKIPKENQNVYESLTNIKYPLPKGWLELEDERGRKYYACTYTKHTQWLHPSIPIGTPMPNGLTYGWDKDFDEDGVEYYINHVGRFNTRNPPVKKRKYLGSDYNW